MNIKEPSATRRRAPQRQYDFGELVSGGGGFALYNAGNMDINLVDRLACHGLYRHLDVLIMLRKSVGRCAIPATPSTSSAAVLAMEAITSSEIIQLPSEVLRVFSFPLMSNPVLSIIGLTKFYYTLKPYLCSMKPEHSTAFIAFYHKMISPAEE